MRRAERETARVAALRVSNVRTRRAIKRHSRGALIAPSARKVILVVAGIQALALVSVGIFQATFNPFIGLVIAMMGFSLIAFATAPARCFYGTLVFAIWFNLGCVLSYADVLLHEAMYLGRPSSAMGAFTFTDGEMWRAVMYLAFGAVAIVVASLVGERLIARDTPFMPRRFRDNLSALKAVAFWVALGVGIAFLLIHFEIGRTGLVNRTELPFHLAGFLSFARGYLIPAFGILILDLLINSDYTGIMKWMLGGMLLVGLLGSIAALSRGYLGFMVMAIGLYFLVNLGRHRYALRSLALSVVLGVPLLLLCIFVVNSLREKGFSGQELSLSNTVSFIRASRVDDVEDIVTDFINLSVGRIGGLQELLGTLSAPQVWEPRNPWAIFMEDSDTTAWLQKSVLGFITYGDEIVGFGYSFSLFGTLSLSGSPWIVFFGTSLFFTVLLCVEELFFRLGAAPIALALAINVGFQFWGFANKTVTMNLIAIVCVIYGLTRLFYRPGAWIRVIEPSPAAGGAPS